MAEIIADLRDDLLETFLRISNERETEMMTPNELAHLYAERALATIKRWCAKEPVNDNE